jgi:hypothetical protein
LLLRTAQRDYWYFPDCSEIHHLLPPASAIVLPLAPPESWKLEKMIKILLWKFDETMEYHNRLSALSSPSFRGELTHDYCVTSY